MTDVMEAMATKLKAIGIDKQDWADVYKLIVGIKRTSSIRQFGYSDLADLAGDARLSPQRTRALIIKYSDNIRRIIGGTLRYSKGYRMVSGNGPFAHNSQAQYSRYAPAMVMFDRQDARKTKGSIPQGEITGHID
jgi:hypothetical protein